MEGDKFGLKMITKLSEADPTDYSNMEVTKNWIDYMEETT